MTVVNCFCNINFAFKRFQHVLTLNTTKLHKYTAKSYNLFHTFCEEEWLLDIKLKLELNLNTCIFS